MSEGKVPLQDLYSVINITSIGSALYILIIY